jgi:hypothetical protein
MESRARAERELQQRHALATALAAQRAAAAAAAAAEATSATQNTSISTPQQAPLLAFGSRTLSATAAATASKRSPVGSMDGRSQQHQQPAPRAQSGASGAVRAPTAIGSYANPVPPPYLAAAQRAAMASVVARAAGVSSGRSAPVTGAVTPLPAAVALSAPHSPGAPPHLRKPTAGHTGHGNSSETTTCGGPGANDQVSELDLVLQGMQDVDGTLQELDDYLERASYSLSGSSSPEPPAVKLAGSGRAELLPGAAFGRRGGGGGGGGNASAGRCNAPAAPQPKVIAAGVCRWGRSDVGSYRCAMFPIAMIHPTRNIAAFLPHCTHAVVLLA